MGYNAVVPQPCPVLESARERERERETRDHGLSQFTLTPALTLAPFSSFRFGPQFLSHVSGGSSDVLLDVSRLNDQST